MKKEYLLFFLPLMAVMAGCTDMEEEALGTVSGDVKSISFSLPLYEGNDVADTRTDVNFGSGITFAWAENDTVGIFPVGGGQVEFPISSAAGTSQANFNGGKWALRGSERYAAYFPYDKWNVFRDSKSILLDYTGQVQVGNNNTEHLGHYDFLGSPAVYADSDGNLNFQLQRFVKMMDFRLTFPEAVEVSTVRVQADEPIFITRQLLNISGDVPTVSDDGVSDELLLQVESCGQVVTGDFYLSMAIQDLTPYQLRIQVTTTDNRFFSSDIESKNLTNSFPGYRTTATLEESEDMISFADSEVERICLENWDSNHDGGLSYREAARVEDLGQVFRSSNIASFDELQYFTGLTSIGNYAFFGCSSLTSINIPDGVKTIGNYAFSDCSSLTSINIPDGVTSIGSGAFFDCSSLTSINIPDGVTSIGSGAFFDCSSLTSINIPDGVTSIGNSAFAICSSLTSINIPDGVTSIGQWAFSDCSSLTSITLPESVTSIETYAFSDCSSLTSINIPDGVKTIGDHAFSGCSSLTSINISDGVKTIGNSAFSDCSSLTSINIPDGVTSIWDGAFYDCI